MLPVLFTIPIGQGIHIYTYGLFMAAAFVSGIGWTLHEARLDPTGHLSRDRVLDLSFYLVLTALAGARIFYIFIEWERYASDPLAIFKIWEGGLVYYGGLLGAIAFSYLYLRKKRLRFLQVADLIAPGIALGYAFARVGCFSAGCCYGQVMSDGSSFAITFPRIPFTLAPSGVPLFPTQLVALASTLVIFGLLVWIRRHKKFTGQIFYSYLILYGVARTVLEAFRAEDVRGALIGDFVTRGQLISLVLAAIGVLSYVMARRRV